MPGQPSATAEPVLEIPERLVARYTPLSPLEAVTKQFIAERRWQRRAPSFRIADPERALSVYARMSPEEFDAINARQRWASWRTIPRAISGRLPLRPLVAIDLGAGTGQSTEVLACFLPPGSTILALEGAEPLVRAARRRQYRHHAFGGGRPARVLFRCQNIVDDWRWPDGAPVAPGSVDLVNATGVIGHHLRPDDAARVLAHAVCALQPGGIAAVDPGPAVPAKLLVRLAEAAGLTFEAHVKSNPLDRWGQCVFRKPGGAGDAGNR